MARWAVWLLFPMLLVVFACSDVFLGSDFARAEEPAAAPYKPPESVYLEPEGVPELSDCPAIPDVLVDGDSADEQYSDEVKELRLQRVAAARTCRALADRSDRLSERVWWVAVELAEGREQRSVTNSKLSQLVDAGCVGACSDAGGGEVSELVASTDAAGEAVTAGVYLLAGLVVSLFVGYGLWRTVDRGI